MMKVPTSQLDDPQYAQYAWDRYRRLMRWMVLASAGAVMLTLIYLKLTLDSVPWLMALFTGLGVFLSVMLAAALMGLVFLSSGSGHDQAVVDPFPELAADDKG
jgi:Na+(H+)/acetate symporter ActP